MRSTDDLQAAHVNHVWTDDGLDNLACLCQPCHKAYDAAHARGADFAI